MEACPCECVVVGCWRTRFGLRQLSRFVVRMPLEAPPSHSTSHCYWYISVHRTAKNSVCVFSYSFIAEVTWLRIVCEMPRRFTRLHAERNQVLVQSGQVLSFGVCTSAAVRTAARTFFRVCRQHLDTDTYMYEVDKWLRKLCIYVYTKYTVNSSVGCSVGVEL